MIKLDLPESALVNKFIPKSKFHSHSSVNTKLKQKFTDQLQRITWQYKLAEQTVNIARTRSVEEIQIFELELKKQVIPKQIIRLIQRIIPYPILFILSYKDHHAYAIVLNDNEHKQEYFTDWDSDIVFTFSGNNLEKVYNNLVKAFITTTDTKQKPFSEIIRTDAKIKELCKEIERFESKIKKEKQFNKKVELNQTLLTLKKQLDELQKD